MVQSVELLLEPAGDAAVREQWRQLTDAALPSQGQHRGASNRPHITLFVAHEVTAELDDRVRDALAAPDFEIRLGGFVVFGGRRQILARSVIPSRALLELHRDVARAARGCRGVPDHILPDAWTPHVTLARRIEPARLGEAVQMLGSTTIVTRSGPVRRWDGTEKSEWLLTPASTTGRIQGCSALDISNTEGQ